MPLAHESKLLVELRKKERQEQLREAVKAAEPLFNYFREERDRIQMERGGIGVRLSIPIAILGDGLWGFEIPWNRAIRLAQAARKAEEQKAIANQGFMDEITGRKKGWLRRLLDRIRSDDCPRCKGLGFLTSPDATSGSAGTYTCPRCNGEGWIDEDEDGKV